MTGENLCQPLFVTRMTAEGPGAVAVLRVWGESAAEVVGRLFQPRSGRKGLADSRPGEIRLGWFGGDEVVALLVENAATGRVDVEIQGHGSELLIESLVQLLESHGAVAATPQAFLAAQGVKKLERLALDALGRAATTQAAAVLYRQAHGALRTALNSIADELASGNADSAAASLETLSKTANFGTRLVSGFRVALAGPPNVGKSTLVNALAGYERAVVSPIPGTTRDAVDVAVVLHGWPIVLTDTAGLRLETSDLLEAEGIRIAMDEHRRADVVLRLTQCGDWPIALETGENVIDVSTKADLATSAVAERWRRSSVVISAVTGEGIDQLVDRIVATLAPAEIAGAEAVVFDVALARSLGEIRANVVSGASDAARTQLNDWLE